MNKNRRKQRPQNRSSVVFVIDRSVAGLGEQDISRHHESALLVNGEEIRAQSILSLELGHYLTQRALTNCTGPSMGTDGRAIDSFSGAQARPSVVCSRFRWGPLAHLSSCHSERSEAQSRNLLMRLTSVTPFACGETNIAARNRRVRSEE